MAEVRLQKFLAECGVGSRRKMEQFIKEGRVRVNQQVVTDLGRKINPELDKVEVNRRPVHAAPKGILLLNKPRGVVSTLSDPEGRRTVADFLTKKYASYFPVGRLDFDSTGLMVLTNDGDLAERLMHPRFGFERIYQARVEGAVGDAVLGKIARGVRLTDGVVKAAASILSHDENTTWLEVSLAEGRNRVVRRLFEKLGHSVMKLKRTVYGPFKLGRLQVGQVRALTLKEYEQARRKVLSFVPDSKKDRTVEGEMPEKRDRVEGPRVDRDQPRRPLGSGRERPARTRHEDTSEQRSIRGDRFSQMRPDSKKPDGAGRRARFKRSDRKQAVKPARGQRRGR